MSRLMKSIGIGMGITAMCLDVFNIISDNLFLKLMAGAIFVIGISNKEASD